MKKEQLVRQRDRSDCGAACLVSVLAHYDRFVSVSQMRLKSGTTGEGTSIYGMMQAARSFRMHARAVRIKEMPLHRVPVPAIFFLTPENAAGHFVVVYHIGDHDITVMDPAFGKMILVPIVQFLKQWNSIVLLLKPAEKFRALEEEND